MMVECTERFTKADGKLYCRYTARMVVDNNPEGGHAYTEYELCNPEHCHMTKKEETA